MGMYDSNNGRPSFLGRFLIPILIAIFGIFTYLSHTEENPVTGKKQHISISPAQEVKLGLESAPLMTKKMGGEIPATDPRSIEVSNIGAMIVAKTLTGNVPWKFKFHLLADEKTINAFALPGGQIFITLGLFNKLQTEAQLAGVLSHEMGHVIERHTAQQMAKSDLGKWLVVAAAVGSHDQHSSGSNYDSAVIASVVNQMFQLHYSREDESQADIWGVKLMTQIGYDPHAMIEVMEILKAAGGHNTQIEMFQTHPNPDARIAHINAYLKDNPISGNQSEGRKLADVLKNKTQK